MRAVLVRCASAWLYLSFPCHDGVAQFRAQYGAEVSTWDICHYVYALLYYPAYRERYAENLKRDLPRRSQTSRGRRAAACAEIGAKLAALHLHYEQAAKYPLAWIVDNDVPFTWRGETMKLSRDKTDKRSGITSDPNRANDPRYIPRLLSTVVTVSVETVRLGGQLRAIELDVGE